MSRHRTLIVGASLAGTRVAQGLREHGYLGQITLVGNEPAMPYDRIHLSKGVLAGEGTKDIGLLSEAECAQLDVDLLLGTEAVSLDTTAKRVRVAGRAAPLEFDTLVIATGAVPRSIRVVGEGHVVPQYRCLADALALRRLTARPCSVAVVGGGFVGSEVAATLRGSGHQVTLFQWMPHLLPEAGPVSATGIFDDLHRDNGVSVHLDARIMEIRCGPDGRPSLYDEQGVGTEFDVAVAALGVAPAVEWLRGCGLLTGAGGLTCEQSGLVAPDIWAVGDVVRTRDASGALMPGAGHWLTAVEQAEVVSRNIAAGGPVAAVPTLGYFSSRQFKTNIQVFGSPTAGDRCVLLDGVPSGRSVSFAVSGTQVVGAVLLNAARLSPQVREVVRLALPLDAAVDAVAAASTAAPAPAAAMGGAARDAS